MTTLRGSIGALVAMLLLTVGLAAPANAGGPPRDVFERNDGTWGCFGDEGAPVPPHHCINIKSKGKTGLILVFPPDDRGPAEGIAGPEADDRPCPHDPGSPDGTWWEPFPGAGFLVCHHQP